MMRDLHAPHAPLAARARIARALALFAALALSGCGTIAGFFGEDEEAPATLKAFEATTAVDTLWSRRVASGEGGQRLGLRPAVDGGRVYAAGHDGDVAAHDPATGERLWTAETGVPVSGGVGAGAGLVVVGGSGGDVIAIDSATGAIAWRARVSSEVLSAPAVDDRIVAVRTVDGKLFGLDPASGEWRWVYDRTVPVLTLRGTSAPAIAGEVAVAGFDDGHLVAISVEDGRLVWESQVAAPSGRTELERLADIDADPVVADGVVYVATFQGSVAAYDLGTGQALWQREMSSHAGIGVGRRLLYVTDDRGHVWALDRRTGASLWRQDGLERRGVTRPVEFGSHVVVADFEGRVHWLGIDDGHFAARVRVGGGAIRAAPVVGDDAVHVLGASGTLATLVLP